MTATEGPAVTSGPPRCTCPAGYSLALRLDLITKQLGDVLEQVALAAAELRNPRDEAGE